MKYSLYFSLFVLFGAYSSVECGFLRRIFNSLFPSPVEEPEEASLVLGIDDKSKYCVIANVPVLITEKDPNFQKYLFACPAENDLEKKINEERSKTKNALFIRETYSDLKLDETENSEKKKANDDKPEPKEQELNWEDFEYLEYDCKTPVIPSVKRIGTDKEHQIDLYFIGFEMFIEEKYKNLKVLEFAKTAGIPTPDFQWFNVLTIRFDHQNGNVLSVNAEIFNDEATVLAPRYQFGEKTLDPKINGLGKNEFYKNIDIESLYSLEMQQYIIFPRIFRDPSLRDIYFNVPQKRYLVENHLAPLDGFITSVLEEAAHSYGNIAPMWKIIKENSWKRVENHIKYLVRGVLGTYVITGTYGTLKLANKEIYLGPDRTVRVPLAFWKVVQYSRKEKEFYNMLIVVSNNPYENVDVDLCPSSQCSKYGWGRIEQDFHPLGSTRCCEVTEENMRLLQLEGFIKEDRILNLKEVPHLDDEKLTLNVAKFIEDRKKEPVYNYNLKIDDIEYRNQPNYLLESEKKKIDDKKKENEGFSVTKFATWVVRDHALPYINSLLTKKKEGYEEKSPFLHELKDESDLKTPLLSKPDGQADEKVKNENDLKTPLLSKQDEEADRKEISSNEEIPTDNENPASNNSIKIMEKDHPSGNQVQDNVEVKPDENDQKDDAGEKRA